MSNIQDYFEYILRKQDENTDNPSVQIYVNKTKDRVTFQIKNGYSLKILTPETMKVVGSIENRIPSFKNGENVPHLKITGVVLVPCNIVNHGCQQEFGSLFEISPTNHIFLKLFNLEYDPHVAKYQLLINKRKYTGQKHFNDPKAFIEYSNDMHDVHENIDNTI